MSLCLAALVAACSGGAGTAPAGDTGAITQKDSGSTAAVDDDTPDKPASLSGSYLAESISCAVPKVPEGARYVSACCNLRDKDQKKIVGKFTDDTFKIIPPVDTGTIADQAKIESVNTSKVTGSSCHVVYRAPLGTPTAGAGLSLTDSGSATARGATAKLIIKRLLYSVPLYKRAKVPAASSKGAKSAKPGAIGATGGTGAKVASTGAKKSGLALLALALDRSRIGDKETYPDDIPSLSDQKRAQTAKATGDEEKDTASLAGFVSNGGSTSEGTEPSKRPSYDEPIADGGQAASASGSDTPPFEKFVSEETLEKYPDQPNFADYEGTSYDAQSPPIDETPSSSPDVVFPGGESPGVEYPSTEYPSGESPSPGVDPSGTDPGASEPET